MLKCVCGGVHGAADPPTPAETLPRRSETNAKTSAVTQKSQFTPGTWDQERVSVPVTYAPIKISILMALKPAFEKLYGNVVLSYSLNVYECETTSGC